MLMHPNRSSCAVSCHKTYSKGSNDYRMSRLMIQLGIMIRTKAVKKLEIARHLEIHTLFLQLHPTDRLHKVKTCLRHRPNNKGPKGYP